jgi:hypothetical protein
MPLREFLRGGYQKIKMPTIVTSRGVPVFTVIPGAPGFRTTEQRATLRPGPTGPSPNGG